MGKLELLCDDDERDEEGAKLLLAVVDALVVSRRLELVEVCVLDVIWLVDVIWPLIDGLLLRDDCVEVVASVDELDWPVMIKVNTKV